MNNLCLVKSKIYFFNVDGLLLNEPTKIINEDNISHITLIPTDEGYFILGFLTQFCELNLILYELKLNSNLYTFKKKYQWNETLYLYPNKPDYNFTNKGLSCEYRSVNKHLMCFFIFYDGINYFLA